MFRTTASCTENRRPDLCILSGVAYFNTINLISADQAPYKSPEKIAGSDEGFDTNLFADPDKNEDQTDKNWTPWVQSACVKA